MMGLIVEFDLQVYLITCARLTKIVTKSRSVSQLSEKTSFLLQVWILKSVEKLKFELRQSLMTLLPGCCHQMLS